MPTPGLYQLLLTLSPPRRLRIGALGEFDFPAGDYLYTGSARGGLEGRLARHARAVKRLRWHIDYLLAVAELRGVVVLLSGETTECALAAWARGLPGACVPVPRFGASDCGCPGHLVQVPAEGWLAAVDVCDPNRHPLAALLAPLPLGDLKAIPAPNAFGSRNVGFPARRVISRGVE
ncbi:MAG: GIY-YIG nuclease family protein [Armatimonadetes bacterium]|nr:GIY-YIG nuclease family protein [Armatimonadota bacterium]